MEDTNYRQLPENWDGLSWLEQRNWFLMYYCRYSREGEIDEERPLLDGTPEEVRRAFADWQRRAAG